MGVDTIHRGERTRCHTHWPHWPHVPSRGPKQAELDAVAHGLSCNFSQQVSGRLDCNPVNAHQDVPIHQIPPAVTRRRLQATCSGWSCKQTAMGCHKWKISCENKPRTGVNKEVCHLSLNAYNVQLRRCPLERETMAHQFAANKAHAGMPYACGCARVGGARVGVRVWRSDGPVTRAMSAPSTPICCSMTSGASVSP